MPAAPPPPPALPRNVLDSQVKDLGRESAVADDDYLRQLDAGQSPFDDLAPSTSALPRQSLFPEAKQRHILAAALAKPRPGGELDLPRLIAHICQGRVLPQLPSQPVWTLEQGCQLLLDYSTSMTPFWEDLNGLIEQVTRVMGAELTQVFSFDGEPRAGEVIRWLPDGSERAWQADGRPVLVATDFGIQGRAGQAKTGASWTTLVRACQQAGSPLLVLIPWPRERWPKQLGAQVTLVHWSRHTSAGQVAQRQSAGR